MERKIRLQREADTEWARRVSERPGCEGIFSCLQCGTCSGTCPLSIYMDLTPRRIIALVREGFRKEALSCQTIWLCASCYSCAVHCPRQIHITDVMYSLKREAIQEKLYPARLPDPGAGAGVLQHGAQARAQSPSSGWCCAWRCARIRCILLRHGAHGLAPAAYRQALAARERIERIGELAAELSATGGGVMAARLWLFPRLLAERHRRRLRGEPAGRCSACSDLPLEELHDWNCCGATSYMSIDERSAFVLSARNLALAHQARAAGPRGAVHRLLPGAAQDAGLRRSATPPSRRRVNAALQQANLRAY